MHLVGYYQVPGARYYLVGVNVEFLPLAVRLLFVGGTNTIPPDVVMTSVNNHDSC